MKIKDVKCEVYLREGTQPSLTVSGKTPWHILRIITDDGIEGFAFSEPSLSEQAISIVKREIVERDPLDREWIWQRLWSLCDSGRGTKPIYLTVLAAVDIALWDIAGKAFGVPIYKLLGAYRDKIRVYASSYRLPTPQDYYNEVADCRKQGITAYKLHVNPEITTEACRAARQAGGDDMVLMLDGGTGGSREQALRVGREIEKLNFYWFEEPVPDYDIEGLIKLREKLNIPICATEKLPQGNMYMIPQYLLRGAVDMVRCDVMISGGITPVKKIADMCDAFGMQCEIHHGRIPTGDIANLHVQCAIKNCEFYELLWMWPGRKINFGLKEYPVLDDEGYLHVLQKPGLGAEIDWQSLGKPAASY